jgi:hypothetical protein
MRAPCSLCVCFPPYCSLFAMQSASYHDWFMSELLVIQITLIRHSSFPPHPQNFKAIKPVCGRCLSQDVSRLLHVAELMLLLPVNCFEVHSGLIGGLTSKTSWIRSLVGKCGIFFLWTKWHWRGLRFPRQFPFFQRFQFLLIVVIIIIPRQVLRVYNSIFLSILHTP